MNLQLFTFIYNLNNLGIFSDWLSLFLGEYLIYFLGIMAVVLIVLSKNTKEDKGKWLVVLFLACCLSNLVASPLIHFFYKTPRPFMVLTEIINYKDYLKIAEYNTSFPSGHTSLAFAVAVVLFLKNKRNGSLLLILAILIGIGRILMGVHWPLDIMGGIGVGILCALMAYKGVEKILTKTTP